MIRWFDTFRNLNPKERLFVDFLVIQFEISSYCGINDEKLMEIENSLSTSLRLWTSTIYVLMSAKENRISSGELSHCFLTKINTQLKKKTRCFTWIEHILSCKQKQLYYFKNSLIITGWKFTSWWRGVLRKYLKTFSEYLFQINELVQIFLKVWYLRFRKI